MTIFVTGGAGYIGSHAILALLEQGYDVVAADNFFNSKPESIRRVKELAGVDFPFYEIDVRDALQLDRVFSEHDVDCVIHFAGMKAVGESVEKPLEYYANNLNSTISLCRAMKKHDVTEIIFSSSATVYDAGDKMPLTENSRTGGCTNPYGWTKFMCEQILTDAVNASRGFDEAADESRSDTTKGWSLVLLRYFNPIGAHESGRIGEDPQDIPNNLMPFIAQTAVGRHPYLNVFGDDYDTPDGTCLRDYIHVVDLAAGHVAAINYLEAQTENEGTGYASPNVGIFNLGTGKGVSVLELVSAFEEATGVSIPIKIAPRRPGDGPVCYASTDKAKKELGWSAKKTLLEACADTWRWQKNNPMGYGG